MVAEKIPTLLACCPAGVSKKLTFFKTASAPIDKAVTKRRLTSILVPASIAAACARPGSEKPAVESLAS